MHWTCNISYNLSFHVAQLTVLDCDRSSSVIPENDMAFLQWKSIAENEINSYLLYE